MVKELTVTEALNALKLTNKKIEDATGRVVIGFVTTAGSKNVPAGFSSRDEYVNEIQSRLDSVNGLVRYRDNLKKAVVVSNARTTVKIGSAEMTVAQAIEQKESITYKKKLLNHLETQFNTAQQQVDRHNATLEGRADEFVTKVAAAGQTMTAEERMNTRKRWIEENTASLVTANNTRKTIDSLREEISNFESNVDVSLSVVNAKTVITVED